MKKAAMISVVTALILVTNSVPASGTSVVESVTGSSGDWTYTYTITNGASSPIWQWCVWFPSDPNADSTVAHTANWDVTNLSTQGFFPQSVGGAWPVKDSSNNPLTGPNGEPGLYSTWANDYGSSNPGEYYTGVGYWDPTGTWEPLPANEGDAPYDKVWRGTKDYGYPWDFWGWDGPAANVTTSFGIAPAGTGAFSFHSASLVPGEKSFSYNTTNYCYGFYDPYDGSDNVDFEHSGFVVPEPASLALLALGGLGLLRRRRQ